MRNILPWILAGLFLFLAVLFYWQKHEAESRLAIADNQVEEIDEELAQKDQAVDSLEGMVMPPDTMELVPPGGAAFVDELGTLSEADTRRLKQKGLQHPETDLLNDLNRQQSRLIPVTGSVGGTMAIQDSRILNDRYAMAYYEDGHNGGYMLLKYTINNGSITWTVLDNSRL